MLAGTRIERMTVASRMTATANPKPTCCMDARLLIAKPANTATMIAAAPVMSAAVWRVP